MRNKQKDVQSKDRVHLQVNLRRFASYKASWKCPIRVKSMTGLFAEQKNPATNLYNDSKTKFADFFLVLFEKMTQQNCNTK